MNLIHSIAVVHSWTIDLKFIILCCLMKMAIYSSYITYMSYLQGPGGQLGQMELQLLWVEGLRAPLATPPETLHLPPIEEQRCSHTALPPRTSWPVTNTMLKSIV